MLEGDSDQVAKELNPFAMYIEVPILFELDLRPYEYVRPHLIAGPCFDYLINDGVGMVLQNDKRLRARELTNVSSTNFGFIVGIRMSFPARRDRGYIEIRYQQSLDSFLDDVGTNYLLINDDGSAVTMGGPGLPDARQRAITVVMGLILD
ncbi:hypothetical protein BMS3Bbin04_00348 [bacterium BMS3Bbin04]|nr:hypothetical protein BMS3Bbin04_00348 [bacterium BMS3Bbin04]